MHLNFNEATHSILEKDMEADRSILSSYIINRVRNKEACSFELITNFSDFIIVKQYIHITKKLAKYFKRRLKALIVDYAKKLSIDAADYSTLISGKELEQCVQFFNEEHKTAVACKNEYKLYMLTECCFFRSLFGKQRPAECMYDYRE